MLIHRSVVASGVCAAVCSTAMSVDVTPEGRMMRWPDVSASHVCFVYANDIWMAPRTGGAASPLASPPGQESYPRFSPDGKTIAFVGNYDGNRDLYTIPAAGGLPSRVTHHPAAESFSEWTADGRLLYMTNGFAGLQRQQQLFTVAATGGLPEQLPVPYGGFASISPDGTWLAYTPHSTDNRTWKRYRGGMATDVWLFNLKDKTSRKSTEWEGTDTIPMWIPGGDSGVVYYLSDQGPEHRLNIWSYTIKSGRREQLTTFKDDDVRWPSSGPGPSGKGEIIFQLGSDLRLLDLGTKKDTALKITIPGDRASIRPRSVDAAKNITGAGISPTGKRVAVEARGDIWSNPAKEGVVRNLTRTDGVYERSPSWSPDGKWIAYFSDESGEYELWVRSSDAKPAEKKDDEKADKDADNQEGGAGDEDKQPDKAADAAPAAPTAPRKVTTLGAGFRFNPVWSPDSKSIVFSDHAGQLTLVVIESGETKVIDSDPWGDTMPVSWSHDSRWLAYARPDDANANACIWVYNAGSGEKTRVTSPMFASTTPAFDRKGDYLFFRSNRDIQGPVYSDLDTTFVYAGGEQLFLVPLRKDLKSPWATRSDEEELKKEEAKPDDTKDEKKNGEQPADKADDGLSGTWEGKATGNAENFPPDGIDFTMTITLGADGKLSGRVVSAMGDFPITGGSFDRASGALTITFDMGDDAATLTGKVTGDEASGTWTTVDANGSWSCKRTAQGGAAKPGDSKSDDKDKGKAKKDVRIDLDGFESRAILVPVPGGSFGDLAVADGNKLVYVRRAARGGNEPPSIKIFDPADEAKEEKAVTAGGGFDMSADGKKLLVGRGGSMNVVDAASGGKSTSVVSAGMNTPVDPRREWRQIFMDTWRFQRDYFYEPTMHGVDWPRMRDHYSKMLDDCTSREDVAYVLGELISELNVGHAYVRGLGDVESSPNVSVGMLGCDFELHRTDAGAFYRITRIHEGGPWDADGRGPLSQPGVDVKVGDCLIAVNGVPVDDTRDPWAAFLDTAGRATTITVSATPSDRASWRDALVTPAGGEDNLRFRAWIEKNRKYVEEKSGGKIGYVYVPNTGVDGQNELFRQFYGQFRLPAIIIDERWNGGGQIPTRFIELLNRPVTNYWARRHGKDWPWPPDSHQGPKCMLINGLAGSGGDAFPAYFKKMGLGPLIGTRTWGGLVGISGNPGLIDGGTISVPTFGYYDPDGTWGIEGHGVDADIEVIDDPALMMNGGDPQLDRAIQEMLAAIEKQPYVAPKRPASPDRSGMGIKAEDK